MPDVRRALVLAAVLAASLSGPIAQADVAGCALPADPYGDAGLPNIMGINGAYTTPLAYQLDEHYGDPVDIGGVWLRPGTDTLQITMQVKDLTGSDAMQDELWFLFEWAHPDAPRDPYVEEREFPTSVSAFYDDGSWSYSAAYKTAGARAYPAKVAEIPGAVDLDAELVTWEVPIDRAASGTRMRILEASARMGLAESSYTLVPRAADHVDAFGYSGYGDDYPRVEFDLDATC